MNTSYKFILVGSILLGIVFVALMLFSLFSPKTPRSETTTVTIKTNPEGALVVIPEKQLSQKAPLTLKNVPLQTNLTVQVSKEHYNPLKTRIAVTTAPEQTNLLTLTRIGEKPKQLENDLDDRLIPTINPSVVEKLKKEPFWNMLPYFDPARHFTIEYKDSDDTIVITTFARGQEENFQKDTLAYRQEAREWLQANGATLSQLTIQYNPTTP